jgi:PST family polysaccharide transporter
VSLALGAAATKVIAVVLGPAGIGLFSLLRQTQQTAVAVGSISGQTALVQGLASREGEQRGDFLVTAFWILTATCGLTCLGLLLFPAPLAHWVTGVNDKATVQAFRWLAAPVLLLVFVNFVSGVLNAYRAIGRLASLQVASTATMAIAAYPISRLVQRGHPVAFVWLMSVSAAAALSLGFLHARREGWLAPLSQGLERRFKMGAARHFLSMAGTMLMTSFVGAGTQLVVRALVNRRFGLSGVGILDVAWTLSMMYVTLVLASFGTYYLPTLSGLSDQTERTALARSVLRFSTFTMVPLVVCVVVLKPLVIGVFYSHEFAPSLSIIRWMLIGDYFKVASWVLAMPMLAYSDMRSFFLSEIGWNAGLLGFAAAATTGNGSLSLIGVGFLTLYVLYLAYTTWYSYSRYRITPGKATALRFFLGLLVVTGASAWTWDDHEVRWPVALASILFAVLVSLTTLSRSERKEIAAVIRRNVRPERMPGGRSSPPD